ncbi:alpha-glucuronidase family glycosyl hydrolase [Pullulanibacillus sp. KACC 23026]|uniref:alpha-glucuronidase family glycosyl hydrolase n=1 Tax=Pullulanibacillus sp. KACC 23026 TaxID=3028315 RepID=UPI0023B0E438|nr:alpha-glucuronidase family glycosyl hydrolase [Pullulanibacillus sp. KACC 23026]WEG11880.1 alpha-glucuronidase family glycosyl hydrolase [Pullulanibacillus sp. KACC 23026]
MKTKERTDSTSYRAWLQYNRIEDTNAREGYLSYCQTLVALEESPLIQTAMSEFKSGIESMLGQKPVSQSRIGESGLVLGTLNSLDQIPEVDRNELEKLNEDGFVIRTTNQNLFVIGKTEKGVIYGTYKLLSLIQRQQPINKLNLIEQPKNKMRMLNHWDNMDGSIERGYAGRSIFFDDDRITKDYKRIRDYARLLASIGINALTINNVNVHAVETKLIDSEFLPEVAKLGSIFNEYGIQLFLSVNYASPMQLGNLPTADPLDPDVKQWWKEKVSEIYSYMPNFGGFVVKADSEHRPGPFTYGRNHADGANLLADALKPFDGIVFWRCFVYNCLQDWRDRSTDRARAAYDHFKPLDGQFLDNVVLQIKNGPMDFQVREAVSPLFGAMPNTNQIIEFQVTQEYTGQQIHLCYLIPQWKEFLDFDTYAKGEGSYVKRVVDGTLYPYKYCGVTAVTNIGLDLNWTGHTLAQANLFGYGRLTWDPDLSTEAITSEWIEQTFGNDPAVNEVIKTMLLSSWPIYENYTSPLGVGWMVNPGHHYGPNVDGYEYSVWGTYHFADRDGIGVDRTKKTGTGYTGQYFPENEAMYESLETCPDELLLFFHHVPYTHRLKSGKTVIQHIYDTHFEGVEQAEELKVMWRSLKGKVDDERYEAVLDRLSKQAEHSKEWRDIINTYFYRKSGITDEKGRLIY